MWSRGVPVSTAMMTQYASLSPQAHVDEAVQALLRTNQSEFPVVDADGKPVGLLGRATGASLGARGALGRGRKKPDVQAHAGCDSQQATCGQTADRIFLPMNRPRCPQGASAFVPGQRARSTRCSIANICSGTTISSSLAASRNSGHRSLDRSIRRPNATNSPAARRFSLNSCPTTCR
jgi:hypothetical protein